MFGLEWSGILIIIAAFFIGYKVVGHFFDKRKSESTSFDSQNFESYTTAQNVNYQNTPKIEDPKSLDAGYDSEKLKYMAVLGLQPGYSQNDLRLAYTELLDKYHPEKIKDFDADFKVLADQKVREVMEAYQKLKA